ncbi:DUF1254 domain-containing protein [Agromyces bracchium]|uniref:DUF1254 domain-containing protein n=1 Tax=Agromyces bracchium TaxID=88376 RepID=A0A6I3MA02_9MICO|nr:DUF1254 domain-containing protein [Agromyces bracchium]MTH70134.1 DUF1254 domain-containing protein [Agromyces bracchium]
MAEHVNVDDFARAETNRMFAALSGQAGGTGKWVHNRVPTPLENQPVIRQNRDTLYSMAVIDVSDGASITIPDAGDRYLSVMVVNQDHYIPVVLREPGEHRLHADELGTQWVVVVPRLLVNPDDEADVAAVNALQDAFVLDAPDGGPFPLPEYDDTSFTETRNALLALARGVSGFARAFGRADEVDPVHHLLGTAAGWGGLPSSEAFYVNVEPKLPVGAYALTVRDVPVDAFWSVTVYNADGFMEATDGLVSVNSVTATPNDDGSTTVNFGGPDDGRPNRIGLMDGWNYIVRLYRPRPEVVDGTWTFPEVAPA